MGARTKGKKKNREREELCTHCGGKGHGRFTPTLIRRRECPAFGKTCSKCGKDHHTAKVCRSERSENTWADTLSEVSMCNLTSLDFDIHGILDHVYHEPSHKWVRRRSKPQPFIRLSVETNREDYQQLGYIYIYRLTTGQNKTMTEAMADTGYQSCLTGTAILHRLGLPLDDLIPVTLSMRAANDSRLEILGAAILRLSDPTTAKTTRQMVYVTPTVDKLFLSQEACTGLGIEPSFPNNHTTGIADSGTKEADTSPQTERTQPTEQCNCPRRQQPPTRPHHSPQRRKSPGPIQVQHIQYL